NETFQDLLKSYSFDGFNLFMATGPISGEMTDSVKEAIYIEILRRSASNLMNLAGFKYITDLEPGDSESDAVKAYASSYPISEQLFADAKADFQRMQYASGKLGLANYVNSQNPNVISIIDTQKYGLEAFETITHRYNNENGYYEVPLTYENTSLSTENQQVYKEMIAKLPESIRSNILKLVVTDNQLPAADETDDPIAVNYYSIGSIYQEHLSELETSVLTPTGKKIIVMAHHQPLALMDNLLHELSHTVDRRSGTIVKDINLYKEGQTEKLMEAGRLSHSEDFINIFEEFFLPKEDLKIYMRYSPTEAFADSLGEYINHKLFGIPYTRYKKVDGVVYEYKPSYAGMSEEYDAMAETVYSIGYSPVEASESYWDALYKKLFEESGTTELVATTVTTKVPAQNGKILIGTKPKTEITVIQFETVEQEDSNQLVGYREIIQVGKNGQLQTLTTYTVDSVTGEVTAQTDTVVLSNVVNEIILIGTKVVENDSEKIVEKPSVNEVPSGDVVIQPKTPYKLSIDDLNDVVEEKSAVVETEDNKQTEVKLVTQRSSNQVIDRRQSQETYEAKLPNTGEASSVTYMLIGASLIALAAGTRKRRQG
ncbi:G5 domain-containing protein, partial [Streptococcus hyovaginalis]|uniref:G5 domain-containing protein n=1 Tax=Streptococcus hyovaginalis TaxID=149015 RepID=UPI002A830047